MKSREGLTAFPALVTIDGKAILRKKIPDLVKPALLVLVFKFSQFFKKLALFF
jgi:hypothetical protein